MEQIRSSNQNLLTNFEINFKIKKKKQLNFKKTKLNLLRNRN